MGVIKVVDVVNNIVIVNGQGDMFNCCVRLMVIGVINIVDVVLDNMFVINVVRKNIIISIVCVEVFLVIFSNLFIIMFVLLVCCNVLVSGSMFVSNIRFCQ